MYCCSWLFHWLVAPKGSVWPFVSSSVYRQILLSKRSFKRLISAFLEQLNNNIQGISIPPHSCLQWRLWPVTSMHIFPPCAVKYHKIHEYSRGKWPAVSLFFTTFIANLSTALSGSCSAWTFFFYSLVECKFLHVGTVMIQRIVRFIIQSTQSPNQIYPTVIEI